MYVLRISPSQHVHFEEVWVLKWFGFHTLQLLLPKTANDEGFWAISWAQIKISMFCAYLHLNMFILKRYECWNDLDFTHCNCYSQKTTNNEGFWAISSAQNKIGMFRAYPIPTCWFWRGMSVKIIWIWHTGIFIAKNHQRWCFLGIISALNKIFVFCAYPHPIMLIKKRYEC